MSSSTEREDQVAVSRRALLQMLGVGAAGLTLSGLGTASGQAASQAVKPLPDFTGPDANPYWNSLGPYVTYPQKVPLLRLTDRPVQLETPRHYFRDAFTPNDAFFVRYHLAGEPNQVDLSKWRLNVEGQVTNTLALSFSDLLKYDAVQLAAVNECSGNSRSRFQPRVGGGQWGHGAVGNALWTGVRLRDVLKDAGVTSDAVQLQFQGLDFGPGPKGYGSHAFLKSWDVGDAALDNAVIAYAMNGEPLPFLNGFPVRMVFPGKFATYWVKGVTWIRALNHEDSNFWMANAYKIPNTPNGDTTPDAVDAGNVEMVPIGTVNLPVRSFLATPDGSSKVPAGLPVTARGVAFSGYGRVTKVEFSADDGSSWVQAELGEDHGSYSFRTWRYIWTPPKAGSYTLAVRATDAKGNVQPDKGVWNPGGYLWNEIERQAVVVGQAS